MNCYKKIFGNWCKNNYAIYNTDLIFSKCNFNDMETQCPNFTTKPSRYISKSTRYKVLQRQYWKCNSCGKHLKYSNNHQYGEEVAHIDHIHPFAEWETYDGDINELANLQALCGECNGRKYSRKD